MKRLSLIILALAALISCGGGGGGSSSGTSTDSSIAASDAVQVGDAVFKAISLNGLTGSLGQLQKTGADAMPKGLVLRSLAVAEALLPSNRLDRTETMMCSNGGMVTTTTVSESSLTATFSGCTEGPVYMSGIMQISRTATTLDLSLTGFTYSDTSSDTGITANLNFHYSDLVFSGGSAMEFTCTIDGSISGEADGVSASASFDDFVMTYDSGNSGTSITMSGNIKDSCLDAWLSLRTDTPVSYPPGSACPTDGDITASAGSNSVRVRVSSDSKIEVSYNGTPSHTYDSCSDITGECR